MPRRILHGTLLLVAALLLLLSWWLAKVSPPALVNLSASTPEGLYVRVDRPERLGDFVAACLPVELAAESRERGYVGLGRRCAGSTRPILKRLAAVEGMWIERTATGLAIDGVEVAGSQLQAFDRSGRALAWVVRYPYRVSRRQVLLLNEHPDSFDGRYFGPLPRDAMLGVYRPWWIWD